MDAERLVASVRRQAPAGACVTGGLISLKSNCGEFFVEEACQMARAFPRRRSQFQAGRAYARAALNALGCPPVSLLRGPRGPDWPPGYCGSIAHSGPICLAVVASRANFSMIGVDIERAAPIAEEAFKLILAPQERAAPPLRPEAVTQLFVAKEASFKLASGLGLDPPELRAMRVRRIGEELLEVHSDDGFVAHVRHGAAQGYFFAIATPPLRNFALPNFAREGIAA
jgi:phosphopantetheinyl transferase